ncbi:hypothetical protein G6F56_002368 [Rhizopus delemar]|uniref:Amine oxidase domain-containing protein n=1 Tax=Rhizopus stolonifer TaxID=4846 RepID=A0A367KSM9_RHIST|nr:hypothetical protein G6F56_002368 [Rhizopus delemar]RCI05213.1 hypothetical protein CU098_012463 [Rhizopus stolonifer]
MKKVRVAVIGSGLAGLSTAYLLSKDQEEFEVHLFEKNSSVGMDASSISIGPKKEHRIDVPMRSFKSGYYSHLLRLYQHLDIPAQRARFSFGWYLIRQETTEIYKPSEVASYTKNEPYLIYSGSKSLNCLHLIRHNTHSIWEQCQSFASYCWTTWIVVFSYFQILFISLYMHYFGYLHDPNHIISQLTLEDFFSRYYIHSYFAHKVFIPLFAAVCTNSYQSMLQYPATDVLEYLALGLFEESYVAGSGVQQVVQRLSEPLHHIHLETQIVSIRKTSDYEILDEEGKVYHVDHIVFATQGNQAARLLNSTHQRQIEVLQAFEYDQALVINHTDVRLLPNNPEHWRTLNFAIKDSTVKAGQSEWLVPYETTMATHVLNMTHTMAKDSIYLQTTNPCVSVDPKKVLSVAWFERATVTLSSKRALQSLVCLKDGEYRLGPLQGLDGIWFVGSYCWKGIPLLEGCVASAEHVGQGIARSEGILMKVPWNQ